MDLRTFIRETLCQISDGMIDAQEVLRGKGVQVNPVHQPYNKDSSQAYESAFKAALQTVDFDIALTVTDATKGGGGISIAVLAASLKGEATQESSNASVTRVRFQIVAHLPRYTLDGTLS